MDPRVTSGFASLACRPGDDDRVEGMRHSQTLATGIRHINFVILGPEPKAR